MCSRLRSMQLQFWLAWNGIINLAGGHVRRWRGGGAGAGGRSWGCGWWLKTGSQSFGGVLNKETDGAFTPGWAGGLGPIGWGMPKSFPLSFGEVFFHTALLKADLPTGTSHSYKRCSFWGSTAWNKHWPGRKTTMKKQTSLIGYDRKYKPISFRQS